MKKKGLQLFAIISILIILTPIFVFLLKFNNQSISEVQSDWADFATYLNGILTPIIALLSLIILIYIYLFIQKLSSEENLKLFKLQRRILAYNELLEFMPTLYSLNNRLEEANFVLTDNLYINKEERFKTSIDIIKSILDDFAKYYFIINSFFPKSDHLFTININNSTYRSLVKNSRDTYNELFSYYKFLASNSNNQDEEDHTPFSNLESIVLDYNNYINFLRTDLYNPDSLEIID